MSKLESFFKSYADSADQLDFKMAHETVGEKVPVISTGSIALDDALSSGGLPRGRIIQYYGKAASGKTMMCMLAMKEAQLQDPLSQQVFIDAEQTFDPNWAETLGVDTSRVILVEGDTAVNGRKCFEMLLGVPKEDAKHILKGKSKEGLLDKIANKEFNINMIVLDSIGAIIPPGEDTSAVGKMNMSLLSRFLTPTFRRLSLEVNKANVCFICINHTKAGMDSYGPDHSFTGGNSYTHTLSASVYFTCVNRADAKILDDAENKVGQTTQAVVEKSKFGPHPRKCEFRVDFGVGIIDKQDEIAKLAIDYDVVLRPTNSTYEFGERKWVGNAKFCEAVKDDPALANELIQKITEARDNKWEIKRAEQAAKKVLLEEKKNLDEVQKKLEAELKRAKK